jgi:CheY-like chemotaxis protein
MSHELRTPLNSILGFAQLLHRDKKAPLTEKQREKLDYVIGGGEHLLRLIDDILDLSRIEAGRLSVSLEPVSISEVLNEVRTTLEPMASRAGVNLSVRPLPEASPMVVADRTRLIQILINYGSNAVKYGKPGGSAVFSMTAEEDGHLRVSVADDGIGVPGDKQDKLFQPFQRAGQETGPIQGTGIGLAITKRLAELMRARVGFESSAGVGSTFWIDLPLYAEPIVVSSTLRAKDDNGTSRSVRGRRHTIAYIEDNPSNIAFMQDLIEELDGVTLLTIPTAEVGIEVVRDQRPDVVIMDINLPGMSGYEATQKLAEWPETKHIPVIALTAAAMTGDRNRYADAGFYRYFTKPVNVAELLATLEQLLI